ncbi:MAG TPA: hypothetical protein VH418_07665 [Solirubrobacteraceae bacterium]
MLRGLPREVADVVWRHRLAAAVPAALLGAGADVLIVLGHDLGREIAVGIVLAVAFEMYVGYAELLVAADRREGPRPSVRLLLRDAWFLTPRLLLTSAPAVGLPLAASGLLVLPGLWLLTRWSLYAPAIVHEGLGARAGLARSAELVRGNFWAVACSVTAALLIEHAVIHGTAHSAEPVLGSHVLGLAGAALATAIVSPPAAFTISLVYERLAEPRLTRFE